MTTRVLWKTSTATLIKIEGAAGANVIPMAGILAQQSEDPTAPEAVTITGINWTGTGGTATIVRGGITVVGLSKDGSLGFDEPFYDNGYAYSDINVTTTGTIQIWLTLHRARVAPLTSQITSILAKYSKAWMHDFGDKSSMYQDAGGTTPVTASGQPIGLILDKSLGMVRGAELTVNGDFSNGSTGWSASPGWTFTGGQLVATNVDPNTSTFTTVGLLQVGKWYELKATCTSITTGSWKMLLEGGANVFGDITTTGTFRGIINATTSGNVYIWANSNLTASFDNVSVKELPGNHAIQSNGGKRPIYTVSGNSTYAVFDGVDDGFVTSTIDLTATDKVTVVAGVRKLSDVADGAILSFGAAVPVGSFDLRGPGTAGANKFQYSSRASGTAVTASTATPVAPVTVVATGITDIAAPNAALRINGIQVSSVTTTQGTGTLSSNALNIGSLNDSTLPFNGFMTVAMGVGAAVTADELAILEAYATSRNAGL